jgi:hypothetical protein
VLIGEITFFLVVPGREDVSGSDDTAPRVLTSNIGATESQA